MKRFILGILLVLVCWSCNKESNTQEVKYTLSVTPTEMLVDSSINEFYVRVESNYIWSATVDVDWVTISPEESLYEGSQNLRVRVAENEDTLSRTANINFVCDENIVDFAITQEGFNPYIDISNKQISFGYRIAEVQISITSNCEWYARSDSNWIIINPSTGLIGKFNMLITSQTNETDKERIGSIEVWNDRYGIHDYIAVIQQGRSEVNNNNYIDEYGVDYGGGVVMGGLTWAPVNCGFHAQYFPYGKMYQWGRKYGLGYHNEDYTSEPKANTAETWNGENGAEDPGTFYVHSSTSKFGYDWIVEGSDMYWNLGTDENPVKNRQFDPCPEGWRIPTSFELNSLLKYADCSWCSYDDINGIIFSKNTEEDDKTILFFPAGGRLNTSDGEGCDRAYNGYYWAISASNGSSAYLYFYSDNCSINMLGSRAGGCLTRCVKE